MVIPAETLSLLAGGFAGLVLVIVLFTRSDVQSIQFRLNTLSDKLDEIAQDIMVRSLIARQVEAVAKSGPETIRKLDINQKLSSVLMQAFNMSELKDLAFALDLNGSIEWVNQIRAVTTILQAVDKSNKFMELLNWIEEKRPGQAI